MALITDAFYPGMLLESAQNALMTSALWPLVLDIHYKHKLVVIHYTPQVAILANPEGFGRLVVSYSSSEDMFKALYFDAMDTNDVTSICSSKSTKYIAKNVMKYLDDSKESAEKPLSVAIRTLAYQMKEKNSGPFRRFSWAMDNGLFLMSMVQVALGERTTENIPDMAKSVAKSKWGEYQDYLNKQIEFDKTATDIFGGQRYVLSTPNTGYARGLDRPGIMFGIVDTRMWSTFRETKWGIEVTPPPSATDEILPIKLYPHFDQIPDQYRDDVLSSLTMAKLSRNDVTQDNRGIGKYFPPPSTYKYYPESSMVTWSRGYTNRGHQWLMLPKQ